MTAPARPSASHITDAELDALNARLDAARALRQPEEHLGHLWCSECSVKRRTGPRTEEWVAFIPHPCPTLDALNGEAAAPAADAPKEA